ncbi:MAG: helix-turn-helix domain-containing protein [Prochlorococcus sp.]
MRLRFTQGVARLACSFGELFPDITLAFCGEQEVKWLSLPFQNNFILEAMSTSSLELQYEDHCLLEQDLIWEWLFDLHLVRHPVGAEARVAALLQLLVNRFGIRRSDGYLLPFVLGHARMAELIGATRSTVTRQITLLRQQSDLSVCETSGRFILSARVIENMPTPRPRW